MVWIHGGSFISGTGAGLIYRGDDLTTGGDVVVVTINYRLGALGFWPTRRWSPTLPKSRPSGTGTSGPSGSAELGAHAYSGLRRDPDNVTVFGESLVG